MRVDVVLIGPADETTGRARGNVGPQPWGSYPVGLAGESRPVPKQTLQRSYSKFAHRLVTDSRSFSLSTESTIRHSTPLPSGL